jgi:hypothetical protein
MRAEVSRAGRLVARLFGDWGVQSRLQKVDRNNARASEKDTGLSGAAVSEASLDQRRFVCTVARRQTRPDLPGYDDRR